MQNVTVRQLHKLTIKMIFDPLVQKSLKIIWKRGEEEGSQDKLAISLRLNTLWTFYLQVCNVQKKIFCLLCGDCDVIIGEEGYEWTDWNFANVSVTKLKSTIVLTCAGRCTLKH